MVRSKLNKMDQSGSRGHSHNHSQNRHAVLPTCVRLGADPVNTARGVTIAFVDSGFYPHPDLTQPTNRIVAYVDVTCLRATLDPNKKPENWDWHGTMTAVAAAGNGFLSDGIYRGLASEARVVLVKVSQEGRIEEHNIERGLRWVLDNRERFNIRVASISLGGDTDVPYQQNLVDQAAEEAVRAGIVVVVAAGNSGCSERHKTVPPANAPSVITVGGYNDENLIGGNLELYCSSYGATADGIIKPEIIAPAMWVAAPILPNSDDYLRAESLSIIASSPDYVLRDRALMEELMRKASISTALATADVETIRSEINGLMHESKIVATHYQHVDGTSFAAPIVASLVAQMIAVNPKLTPGAVKQILTSTANRLGAAEVLRQGYGAVNASRALEEARRERHFGEDHFLCGPRMVDNQLEFSHHDDSASRVALVGSFNEWDAERTFFRKDQAGIWRARIEVPSSGRYHYKFVIDGTRWIEDPGNVMKEADGFGGYNSLFVVE
jgi:serine protease AprX